MKEEQVILVNEDDVALGQMEKLEAHEKGLLHRAVSVFIFNSSKQLLLQQRSLSKYHSGGLWTNTCCGHPRPGETTVTAAKRRLMEEMGLDCSLLPVFKFQYHTQLDQGLTEHELDHVFVGFSDKLPRPNPEEACAYRYAALADIRNDLLLRPEIYTVWFRLIMERPELPGLVKTQAKPSTVF